MEIETKGVGRVQFGIMSPAEMRQKAVVEITSEETFANGIPVEGGLFDLKMGTIEMNDVCATCGLGPKECPGHFGYLDLTTPIFHPAFMDIIKKVLESICFQCSGILLEQDKYNSLAILVKNKKIAINKRLDRVRALIKTRKYCVACNKIQPAIKKSKSHIQLSYIYKNVPDAEEHNLSPLMALTLLKRISPQDAEILGFSKFNRPEWMILEALPIPPPVMRPTVVTDSNQRGEDDLTIYLQTIVRFNRTISNKISSADSTEASITSFIETLNNYVLAMMIGGAKKGASTSLSTRGLTTKSGKPLKGINDRISGKQGRFRKNGMGKRVDYSARSVITPDPNLDIDQLGMPEKIAKTLSFPEVVNDLNKERIYQYIINAQTNTYPQALNITRNGRTRTITLIKEDIVLETGDIVRRQIIDGDIALFNRQPTLHKMSMMAFKIKVMPGKTFRINLSVTTPFNADFDGDEMNLMQPQSSTSAYELWNLARAPTQIITPQTNGPIIGIVQDSLVGAYLMTAFKTRIPRQIMMNILSRNPYFDGNMPKPMRKDEWAGSQLISTILPPINIQKFTNTYNDSITNTSPEYQHDSRTVVRNGTLVSGAIDKSILGAKKENSFAHVIVNDFTPEHAKDFLSLIQKYTNLFLVYRGFSIGLGDIIPTRPMRSKMDTKIVSGIEEITSIISQIDNNKFIPPPDTTVEEYFESQATEKLNAITLTVASEAIKVLDPLTNGLMGMVRSGSKGEALNIGQIMGCVGQQNVDRSRIKKLYGRHRTLPFFHKNDVTPKSRGFVEHSFLQGISPAEYFFHSMAGREGIIDTAIRTADSGYLSRRLMKAMEDLYVANDNTVRNANGHIVQFLYGEDGIDPIKIERQTILTIFMNNEELKKNYLITDSELKKVSSVKQSKSKWESLNREEVDQLLADRDFVRASRLKSSEDTIDDKFFLPINLQRLIVNTKNHFNISKATSPKTDLTPDFVILEVRKLIAHLPRLFRNQLRDDLQPHQNYLNAIKFISVLIRSQLASRKLIIEHRFQKETFNYLINQITLKFTKSIIDPGEMVGAIASQSLGEPSTQLTLNTFHFSGVGAKSNITAGVPRLRELIDISKKLKNPYLLISIKDSTNKQKAEAIKNQLRNTKLHEFCDKVQIIFDPNIRDTKFPEDKKFISDYLKYSLITPTSSDLFSNWVIRFELNRSKMLYNQMTLDIIRRRLNNLQSYYPISTDDNAKTLVLRVYVRINDISDINNTQKIINTKDDLLYKTVLRGINNLTSVQVRKNKNVKYFDPATGDVLQRDEYYLDTDGTNLKEVLKHPEIDISRTRSTDVIEIYETYGIEAARQVILTEIRQVLAFNGTYVNYHHLALLADIMTRTGNLTSISRHGFNKLDKSPIAKSSFEETVEQLKKAALYTDTDKMNSVSARVLFGQTFKGGTGFMDLAIDESAYGVTGSQIDNLF